MQPVLFNLSSSLERILSFSPLQFALDKELYMMGKDESPLAGISSYFSFSFQQAPKIDGKHDRTNPEIFGIFGDNPNILITFLFS